MKNYEKPITIANIEMTEGSRHVQIYLEKAVDPKITAIACIGLYDNMLCNTSDKLQIRFEKEFKENFDKLWEKRDEVSLIATAVQRSKK